MANEFLVPRIVAANFTVLASTGAQTLSGGVYLPGDCVVTGVTLIDTASTQGSAQTADSSTLHLGVGTVTFCSTAVISKLGETAGVPVPTATALLTADGVYIPALETVYNGEIMMTVGVSNNNSNRTYSPTVLVGYVK